MHKTTPTSATTSTFPSLLSSSVFSPSSSSSRPTTRDGSFNDHHQHPPHSPPPPVPFASAPGSLPFPPTHKEPRKLSFSRKAVALTTGGASTRRRGSSAASVASAASSAIITDAATPPALPDYALLAAAKVQSRDGRSPVSPDVGPHGAAGGGGGGGGYFGMLSRTPTSLSTTTMATGAGMMLPPPTPSGLSGSSPWHPSEASAMHQQITDVATKRISTLDYLRKAHEGRVYWFNTYLVDKPDLARMPCFDPRKLARKATNYLLLGLSIPTINDLYSSSPLEFLRCLNALLAEFDSFQQLHGDSSSSASLSRARLPNMFRRPGGKSRRSTSAADISTDDASYQVFASFGGPGGGGGGLFGVSGGGGGGPGAASAPPVMNFAAAESDLLPGEEYTYLLTPSLPFEPDFFETFATLCDVLVDCYTRFLALVPTPRECSAPVAELFTKADAKLRKIIVQGVVKEFEDHSRSHVKTEVASIGKVVLGGLM